MTLGSAVGPKQVHSKDQLEPAQLLTNYKEGKEKCITYKFHKGINPVLH